MGMFELHNGKYILDEDISAKMQYIVSKKPEQRSADSTSYSWDESGMAELFSEVYENDTRYCPEAKSWYTYDNGAWRKDVGALLVAEKIKQFTRLMQLYVGEIEDEDMQSNYGKFVAKMGDRRFRERMTKDAASVKPISASQFDNNPYLINCLNGTYDLKTMQFKEHNWRDYLTMQTNFEYTLRNDYKCERWERFIKEVCCGDDHKARYLQKALGYSMLGTAKEECMFILHGKTTRNGKSTLLGAIHHLLGDYATVSPVSIICKSDRSKNADMASPTIAALKGKRLVTMAESNQYGKLDEETIKQLTGGEEITARNLYESMMTFLPQFTMWLSCNDLPSVQDKSLFASDRLRVIEFNRHFTPEEQDPNLKDEFRQPDSMKGIFTWLVKGYFLYKREGLKMTADMQKVVRKYERTNDIILQYLEDSCDKSPDGFVKAKTLYDTYKFWCKSNGYYTVSAMKFYSSLESHPEWVGEKVLKDGYPHFRGLQMKGVSK